jgi:hypothetical protein
MKRVSTATASNHLHHLSRMEMSLILPSEGFDVGVRERQTFRTHGRAAVSRFKVRRVLTKTYPQAVSEAHRALSPGPIGSVLPVACPLPFLPSPFVALGRSNRPMTRPPRLRAECKLLCAAHARGPTLPYPYATGAMHACLACLPSMHTHISLALACPYAHRVGHRRRVGHRAVWS